MVVGFLAASACSSIEEFSITELVALAGDQALTDESAVWISSVTAWRIYATKTSVFDH
ncbi:MAG: hypothetical protein CM15mP120_07030 [Pseudomonadota bacterium]|nr:MAG: hypothetical protein CM15mP120_07030 [Pseudomonadota bacterium]